MTHIFKDVTYHHIFSDACHLNDFSLMDFLIESNKISLNDKWGPDEDPLSIACENNNLELAKYLVNKGYKINRYDIYSTPPLLIACENGNLEMVKYLVEMGSDIKVRDMQEETPLIKAVYNNHFDIIKYLLDIGVDINSKDRYGKTILFHCTGYFFSSSEMIKFLIKNGCDYTIRDNEGKLPVLFGRDITSEDDAKFFTEIGLIRKIR